MTENKINVLFVCTGNICRSPMAEYLFLSRLAPNSPWTAGSAGLAAADGIAASRAAIEVMDEIGVNMRKHRSRELTGGMIDNATIILVMTGAHAAELKQRFPKAGDRVHLLGSFNKNAKEKEIPDPVGAGVEVYRRTMNSISGALDGLIRYLQSFQKNKLQ
jgi:protein-tyrosine phosphatase